MGGKAAIRIPMVTRNAPVTHTTVLDQELVSVKCNTIRPSFYNLLRKNQQQIENEYSVECSVDRNDKGVSLLISGKNSYKAMRKSLQLCLDSKIYNFYLCLPVVGKVFERDLDDFKTRYEDKLMGAKWESRPHVTLKMLNIVTNKHLSFTNNILYSITKKLQEKYKSMQPIQIELSALDIFEQRDKKSTLPLFSHTKLDTPLDEISQQLIDAVSSKYDFKNEVIKQYTSMDGLQNENEMTMDDYSLYIHTFDAKNDIIASGQNIPINKESDDNQCDYLELKNNDETTLPESPHVTLIRYNNYKDAIGLQGPKTGLVNTCELRPRHGETTWPYETIAGNDLAFSYNLFQSDN